MDTEHLVLTKGDAAPQAYDRLDVHTLMLNDSQRLGSYLAAIRAHNLQAGWIWMVGLVSGFNVPNLSGTLLLRLKVALIFVCF